MSNSTGGDESGVGGGKPVDMGQTPFNPEHPFGGDWSSPGWDWYAPDNSFRGGYYGAGGGPRGGPENPSIVVIVTESGGDLGEAGPNGAGPDWVDPGLLKKVNWPNRRPSPSTNQVRAFDHFEVAISKAKARRHL